MATRPVFLPKESAESWVTTLEVDFLWHPGLSIKQKQKSIRSLHEAAMQSRGIVRPLEVSTKSESSLGWEFSAFNLSVSGTTGSGHSRMTYSVEGLFQGSKVFSDGGPYNDLYGKPGKEVKRDQRLTQSGDLVGFRFKGKDWRLDPTTAFYDWVYINALLQNANLANELLAYDAFTDIEFNPNRSFNCQAQSVALYVSLRRAGILEDVMSSEERFLTLAFKAPTKALSTHVPSQGDLF